MPPRLRANQFFVTLLLFINMAHAFQVDFSKDDVEKLFDDATGTLPMISQGMMSLPANIETRTLPVEAGKKYKLQITAQVDGHFVVEENDRAHIQTLQSHQQRLSSTYRIAFQDGNGESVPALGGNTQVGAWMGGFFLTKKASPYVMVFYAPENAASLKVSFQSNGRTTYMTDFQLTEETEEGTVNCNPDFRYGELNYSGWKPSRDGRLYKRPDGKIALNTGYANSSAFFPLNSKNKYHVSVTGEDGQINIEYFDRNGKSLAKRFLIRPIPEGAEAEFLPPEGTVMGRLTMTQSQILQEIRIEKAK